MEKQQTESLAGIVSDGYNMKVERISETHVVISIGGSEREFAFDKSVAEQIDDARKHLGCSPLLNTDRDRINEWQSNQSAPPVAS